MVTADLQAERGFFDLAVFSLEQALKLFLKAQLLKYGVDFPKTHSVRRLLKLIIRLDIAKKIDIFLKQYSLELGALEDAYISSRYIPREYTSEDYFRIKKVVEEIIDGLGGYPS